MTGFRIEIGEWEPCEDPLEGVGETIAPLTIGLDGQCLTKNVDIRSGSVRDHALVSLQPLAMWFAASWWRLNCEILPAESGTGPCHDWRMSHEMAAAGAGFVWPRIMFFADGDMIRIRAGASRHDREESARYLNGLARDCSLPKERFEREASSLVERVIDRLRETGCEETDLVGPWKAITEERQNAEECRKRKIEAMLGFDPEECPDEQMAESIVIEDQIGTESFGELAGAFASLGENRLSEIRNLIGQVGDHGIVGNPGKVLDISIDDRNGQPRNIAATAARRLRENIANPIGKLDDSTLSELLGLPARGIDGWLPPPRSRASAAHVGDDNTIRVLPRKAHPVARRFELARFIGDYVRMANGPSRPSWLVTADLSTTRQEFQRAFAAEFLCPFHSLAGYLNGDYSAPALEDAAYRFCVDTATVESLLADNGCISRYVRESGMSCRRGVSSDFASTGKRRNDAVDEENRMREYYAEDPNFGRF